MSTRASRPTVQSEVSSIQLFISICYRAHPDTLSVRYTNPTLLSGVRITPDYPYHTLIDSIRSATSYFHFGKSPFVIFRLQTSLHMPANLLLFMKHHYLADLL